VKPGAAAGPLAALPAALVFALCGSAGAQVAPVPIVLPQAPPPLGATGSTLFAARLAIAHEELKSIRQFDYVLINEQAPPERRDSLPAVDDLEAIVRAERFRIHHYKDDDLKKLEAT